MRAFRLAYDGTDFYGFQRQPDVPTVEDTLFDALAELGVSVDSGPGENRPPCYTAAGRTDAGVSALSQTVALEAPDWLTPAAFNGELPGTIRAWASVDVGEDFHATVDARRREYVYHLYAPDADDQLVARALSKLAGKHDFANLTPDEDGTVRTLETRFERDGEMLELNITAGGFPRHLVRRLVTLVKGVATERVPLERVDRLLDPSPIEGKVGVGPAPPEGLVLWDVEYDIEFTVEEQARASARSVFDELYRERLTSTAVARHVRDALGE